jgi:hypothetical protein
MAGKIIEGEVDIGAKSALEPTLHRSFPSFGNIDADPFIRHRSNELIINESTRTGQAVKARLELDVDADLSDLIAEGET